MIKLPECVQVLRVRDTVHSIRHDFSIVGASADQAAPLLIGAVTEGCHLFIDDHRRDDSGLIFKRVNGVLIRMNGGHGYSSSWSVVTDAEAITEAIATLQATKWGPPSGGGHFESPGHQMPA